MNQYKNRGTCLSKFREGFHCTPRAGKTRLTVEVTSAGDDEAVETPEEVEEEIIVPVDATFTGNEAPEPEEEAPAAPEEPAPEEAEDEGEDEMAGQFSSTEDSSIVE